MLGLMRRRKKHGLRGRDRRGLGTWFMGPIFFCLALCRLIFVVSSSAVWDDRMPGGEYSMGNFVYDRPRLPVGQFTLTTKGTIFEGSMRLDLYNGQVRGSVQTSQGMYLC